MQLHQPHVQMGDLHMVIEAFTSLNPGIELISETSLFPLTHGRHPPLIPHRRK